MTMRLERVENLSVAHAKRGDGSKRGVVEEICPGVLTWVAV